MWNLMSSTNLNWFITEWGSLYHKLGQVLQSDGSSLQSEAGFIKG